MEIKKSPKADLEKGKTLSILMGFVVGLAVLFVGFEWSTRDVMVVQASEGVADIIAEEEVEITRPENTPPPPPPPPAPVVTEVLNVVEDDVELEQQDILSSEDDQTSASTTDPSRLTTNAQITRPWIPFSCAITGYLIDLAINFSNSASPPGNFGISSTTVKICCADSSSSSTTAGGV